jgi:hypothetical protein
MRRGSRGRRVLAAAPSNRTADLLRLTTTTLFLLLGAGAFLLAWAVGPGVPRSLLQSFGGFLIGTVVVGYAYAYFFHEETENRTVAKLDDVLAQRLDAIFPAANEYGFKGFVMEAPRNCFDALGPGDELLWLDTYSPDLRLFAPKLRAAVERGAFVRMLVIAATSETAKMRADEIAETGYDPAKFEDGARDFLEMLVTIAEELEAARGGISVRCYEDLPCMPMYIRVRGGRPVTGVTGFYLTEASFNAVHVAWGEAPSGMLDGFHRYFQNKWQRVPDHLDPAASVGP